MLFPTYMYRVYHSLNLLFFYCLNRHFNMMKADHLILIIHYLSTFYPSIRIIRTQSDNWWKIFYCCISILLVLKMMNRGRISSVGRAFDCRAGGRGFDSRGPTNTQGLKITEKWRYFLCPAGGWTFTWLGWPRKMAVPSPLRDVKYSVPN